MQQGHNISEISEDVQEQHVIQQKKIEQEPKLQQPQSNELESWKALQDLDENDDSNSIDIKQIESLISSLAISENPSQTQSKNARKRTRKEFEEDELLEGEDSGNNRSSLEGQQAAATQGSRSRFNRAPLIRRRRIVLDDSINNVFRNSSSIPEDICQEAIEESKHISEEVEEENKNSQAVVQKSS